MDAELLQTVEESFDHKLAPLKRVYEELDLGDRFIESYLQIVIDQSKKEMAMDPDSLQGLELEMIIMPVFVPKA